MSRKNTRCTHLPAPLQYCHDRDVHWHASIGACPQLLHADKKMMMSCTCMIVSRVCQCYPFTLMSRLFSITNTRSVTHCSSSRNAFEMKSHRIQMATRDSIQIVIYPPDRQALNQVFLRLGLMDPCGSFLVTNTLAVLWMRGTVSFCVFVNRESHAQ